MARRSRFHGHGTFDLGAVGHTKGSLRHDFLAAIEPVHNLDLARSAAADFYVVRERIAEACKRARKMRERHATTDSIGTPRYWTRDYIVRSAGPNQPDGNPCTDVDELVRQFNRAANPHFRVVQYQDLPAKPFLDL